MEEDEPREDGVIASDDPDADADVILWARSDEEATPSPDPPIPAWLETADGDGLRGAIVQPEPASWAPAPAVGSRSAGPDLEGDAAVDLGDDPFADGSVPAVDPTDDVHDDPIESADELDEQRDDETADELDELDELDEQRDDETADELDEEDDLGGDLLLVAVATSDDERGATVATGAEDADDWDESDESDEWDDELWGSEGAAFTSALWSSRPARIMTIVAVVMIVVLLMSTVLLWQRLEDVKADVNAVPTTQPLPDPQLTELRRRLSRLETQVASAFDDSGNVVGATDALRAELAALRQCVAAFQLLAQDQRAAAVIC